MLTVFDLSLRLILGARARPLRDWRNPHSSDTKGARPDTTQGFLGRASLAADYLPEITRMDAQFEHGNLLAFNRADLNVRPDWPQWLAQLNAGCCEPRNLSFMPSFARGSTSMFFPVLF
jgi:hypothetical protein